MSAVRQSPRIARALLLALALCAPAAAETTDPVEPRTPAPLPDSAPNGGSGPLDRFNVAPAPAESERAYLDAAAFRARFENRTVHLALGADHYGSEQYLAGDRTVWIYRDGRCQQGDWVYARQLFCFRYEEDRLSCWRVFEAGGDVFAETADRRLLLKIYKVEKEPLSCRPELLTEAPAPNALR